MEQGFQSVEKLCFSTEKCRICESNIHSQSCIQQGSSLRPYTPPSGSFSRGLRPPKTPGVGSLASSSCIDFPFLTSAFYSVFPNSQKILCSLNQWLHRIFCEAFRRILKGAFALKQGAGTASLPMPLPKPQPYRIFARNSCVRWFWGWLKICSGVPSSII